MSSELLDLDTITQPNSATEAEKVIAKVKARELEQKNIVQEKYEAYVAAQAEQRKLYGIINLKKEIEAIESLKKGQWINVNFCFTPRNVSIDSMFLGKEVRTTILDILVKLLQKEIDKL